MALSLIYYNVDNNNHDTKEAKDPKKPHPWESGNEVIDGMKNYLYVDTFDASKILFFYILWNIVSTQLNKVHQKCTVNVVKSKRVSESIWRTVYQALIVSFAAYTVMSGPENLVLTPSIAWQSWGDSEQLSDSLQMYFLVQLSFHIYTVTDLLKEPRKEHHAFSFLTLHTLLFIMISLFYTLHYYQVGLLVCLFYDTSALAIEMTRVNVYLERVSSVFRYLSCLSFSVYTLLWLCNTLYLYPTKVLYFGVLSTMERVDRPLVETVTFGLLLLQLFNLYWSLILLQWMKKMVRPKRTRDCFIVYSFFHKKGTQRSLRTLPVSSDDEKPKSEAKALVQTVKCVIRLKRKLKRMREEKAEMMAEAEREAGTGIGNGTALSNQSNQEEQQGFEIELNPSDLLTIGLVGQNSLEDEVNAKETKLNVKMGKMPVEAGQQGNVQVAKSSNELIEFSSFTSGEESKSSSDLSLKEV